MNGAKRTSWPKIEKMLKKTLFFVILIGLVVGSVELIAAVFGGLLKEVITFYDITHYTADAEYLKKASRQFDADLGWNTTYDTPYGERPRPRSYERPLITTYGDSFTQGGEVDPSETWQVYLADLLQADVYNLGVGGYGTDQAHLKYLKYGDTLKTRFVMLGIMTENINRCLNSYRPFYYAKTGTRLTKPRFILNGNGLQLQDNPIQKPTDLPLLGSIPFLEQLGQQDAWFNQNKLPVYGFPYSRILFNTQLWQQLISIGILRKKQSDVDPQPWSDKWQEEAARTLMFGILDRFLLLAEERGSIPIIVILPQKKEVETKYRTGKDHQNIAFVKNYCQEKPCFFYEGASILAKNSESIDAVATLYRPHSHIAPRGNELVAEGLYRYLREEFPSELGLSAEDVRKVR